MAVNRKPISKHKLICLYIELNMSKPLHYKNRLLSIAINLGGNKYIYSYQNA